MGKWFHGIRGKLLALVGIAVVVMITIASVGLYGLNSVTNDLKMVMKDRLPITNEVGNLRTALNAVMRFSWKAVGQTSAEAQKKAIADAEERLRLFTEAHTQLSQMNVNAESKKILADISENFKIWDSDLQSCYQIMAKNTPEAHGEASALLGSKINDMAAKISNLAKDLDKISDNRNDAITAEVEETSARTLEMVAASVVVGTVVLLVLGLMFASSLAKSLSALAANLDSGANEVASAAAQVSAASEQLSAAATEQAASLQETVAAAEEMSAMVTRNSESALKGKESSNESVELAAQGKNVVENMIGAIKEIDQAISSITDQVDKSNRETSEIVGLIHEIGAKTKVINEIVFQTNLLSFNASIEAARAGEHGKGFAVVAEEVGNLARMSGAAAQEISNMLQNSIQKVEAVVNENKTSVTQLVSLGRQKVEVGTTISQECGQVLEGIVSGNTNVSVLVGGITDASEEQARGVSQITEAMAQLNDVTQQNSAASQQAASAASELSAQAESMRNAVANLLMTVNGRVSSDGEGGKVVKLSSRKESGYKAAA